MKKRISLLLIIFSALLQSAYAQIVNEAINFDNYVNASDNDLQNYFSGMQSLIQIPNNGITGGCLQTPDSNNWGNDNSRYCSKYDAVRDTQYITSICFKYDPSLVSPNGFDRAVSIWTQPQADFNHYIITSVSHDAKIEIYTYFTFTASMQAMNLTANNWYRLEASFTPSGIQQVYFYGKVEDLGPTGTGIPVLVDSVYDNINDTILARDHAIDVSITGSKNGGTLYLDNFQYRGIKNADSCMFTGIIDIKEHDIKIAVKGETLNIKGDNISGKRIIIYDLNGKIIDNRLISSDIFSLDVSHVNPGIYCSVIYGKSKSVVKKFLIY